MYQFTFEPLHFSFRCGCGFGFEQKFWRINGFGGKKHGSVNLHTPIHPPPKTIYMYIHIFYFPIIYTQYFFVTKKKKEKKLA